MIALGVVGTWFGLGMIDDLFLGGTVIIIIGMALVVVGGRVLDFAL
jgi:hypothetical protein